MENNFDKLIKYAEKYIVENAEKIILAARGDVSKNNDNENHKARCKKLLEKYKPIYDDRTKITFDAILERFCIELQNYQAMPRAINYASYDKDKEENSTTIEDASNKIYEIAKEFFENDLDLNNLNLENKKLPTYHLNLYSKFKSEIEFEEKKTYLKRDKEQQKWYKEITRNKKPDKEYTGKDLTKIFKPENNTLKYNYAWHKYTRGLMDVLIKLKKGDYVNSIRKICEKSDECIKNNKFNEEKFKELKKDIKKFHKDIFSINDTLSYDFFKELYCKNLIKDDIHIVECYKKVNSNKTKEEIDIVEDFIRLCCEYKNKEGNNYYTPYYIDKLLWLCCTGNFYEEGIIITKMNRANFLETLVFN